MPARGPAVRVGDRRAPIWDCAAAGRGPTTRLAPRMPASRNGRDDPTLRAFGRAVEGVGGGAVSEERRGGLALVFRHALERLAAAPRLGAPRQAMAVNGAGAAGGRRHAPAGLGRRGLQEGAGRGRKMPPKVAKPARGVGRVAPWACGGAGGRSGSAAPALRPRLPEPRQSSSPSRHPAIPGTCNGGSWRVMPRLWPWCRRVLPRALEAPPAACRLPQSGPSRIAGGKAVCDQCRRCPGTAARGCGRPGRKVVPCTDSANAFPGTAAAGDGALPRPPPPTLPSSAPLPPPRLRPGRAAR